MTNLHKPVRRSLPWNGVVVEITLEGVRMREKRRRTWYGPYPWGKLFMALAHMEADLAIAARKRARAAKRAAR